MNAMEQEPFTARVPADVERPDEILGSFTLRQVALTGGVGLGLYAVWAATAAAVPTLIFLAAALPLLAVAAAVALGRRDGLPLDVWLLHALRHRQRPRRLAPVYGAGQAGPPPEWVAAAGQPQPLPAPLQLPAKGVTRDGLVDLGDDGITALAQASTVNFGLRSPGEQNALIAGFARWLHGLDMPTQILIRAHRVDLGHLAHEYAQAAPTLPHPALEAAAHAHAAFLAELSAGHELLARRLTLATRDPGGDPHTAHRAAEAARSLGSCEVTAQMCDPATAAAELAAAAHSEQTASAAARADPEAVITGAPTWRTPR